LTRGESSGYLTCGGLGHRLWSSVPQKFWLTGVKGQNPFVGIRTVMFTYYRRRDVTNERHELWRGWCAFGDQQHEDGKREQHGDAKRHLLAGVCRKPKPSDAEYAEPQARTDDVEQVVECSASHRQRKSHVWIRFVAASVRHLVALSLQHRTCCLTYHIGWPKK